MSSFRAGEPVSERKYLNKQVERGPIPVYKQDLSAIKYIVIGVLLSVGFVVGLFYVLTKEEETEKEVYLKAYKNR